MKELHCQCGAEEKQTEEGKCISEAAMKQMQQLWQNITKDAVEEAPYERWLAEGKWGLTQIPPKSTVEKLLQIAKKRAEETDKEAEKGRKRSQGIK